MGAPLPVTKNYDFLMDLPDSQRMAVLEGSTRSSKTISIVQFLIGKCMEIPNLIVNSFREDGARHDRTTIKDFVFVMNQYGECLDEESFYQTEGKWNGKTKVYTFSNGSTFSFHPSDAAKAHGIKSDYAWLNEVMEIGYASYKQIAQRTSKMIIFDFNPSFNQHWVFEKVMARPDCAYMHSTYKDNPFLPPMQVYEIEATEPTPENLANGTADDWHWQVYGLGKRGKIQGAVYKLYKIVDDSMWPTIPACQRHGYAMDFGFHPDPATLIECRWHNRQLFLREVFYEKELLITPNMQNPYIPSIQSRLEENDIPKDTRIYADNAQPGAIRDLRIAGWNVVPSIKGNDSVLNGIKKVQRCALNVLRSSTNLQLELEHYRWKKDASGQFTQYPVDGHNHLLDPLRYWVLAELPGIDRRQKTGNVTKKVNYAFHRPEGRYY